MHKQTTIKTCIIIAILVIVGFGCNFSFAAGDTITTAGSEIKTRTHIVYYAVGILSWARFIPAKIAGMFLTNTRVYGEAIGFDSYLWLCRNVVKNISNFILWFLFVFYIFRMMFGKEEATGVLKNIVVKILVAGIAIQSSWFIIAAILDVSTIATSAIGAIPSQVLAGDPKIENAIENSLIAWKKDTTDKNYTKKLVITGFPNNDKANENAPIEMVKMDWVPINTSVSNKEMIDMIMPNAENLVGPLVFMGTSILDSVEPIPAIDFTQDSMAVIIRIILDWGGILVYSLAMIALAIIALIRIFLLRGFIILSPLILLLFCLEKVGKEKVAWIDKVIGMLKDNFSLQSFLGLAFKPAIITLAISWALILSILMKGAFKWWDSTLEILPGTTITSIKDKVTSNNDWKTTSYTTTMDTQTVNMTFKNMSKNFGEFIVTLVTLFLMAFIIKLAVSSKTGIKRLDDKVKATTEAVGDFAKNIPIIPIGSNGGGISYGNVMGDGGNTSLINRLENNGILTRLEETNRENMNEFFGIKTNEPWEGQYKLLNTAIDDAKSNSNKRDSFVKKTIELGAKYKIGLGVPKWREKATIWMDTISQINPPIKEATMLIDAWKTVENDKDLNKKRTKFLKNDGIRDAYRKMFGWQWKTPDVNWLLNQKSFNSNNTS